MTNIEPRAARTSVTDQPRLQRRPRVNLETWSWYFMRISGLLLVFLALFHFFLTHIANDVADTSASFVQQRWKNPLWRLYDWTMLSLALLHGTNGIRVIIEDYVSMLWKRAALKTFVYTLVGVLFAYGTLTVITFQH